MKLSTENYSGVEVTRWFCAYITFPYSLLVFSLPWQIFSSLSQCDNYTHKGRTYNLLRQLGQKSKSLLITLNHFELKLSFQGFALFLKYYKRQVKNLILCHNVFGFHIISYKKIKGLSTAQLFMCLCSLIWNSDSCNTTV